MRQDKPKTTSRQPIGALPTGHIQIGLGNWHPDNAQWFTDMGLTWTKFMLDVGAPGPSEVVIGAFEAGVNIVIDLRPSTNVTIAMMEYSSRGDEDALKRLTTDYGQQVGETVAMYKRWCHDFEVWGEFACPVVGKVFADSNFTYQPFLMAAYQSAKEADPECRVWNGGYGVNMITRWMEVLIEECPGAFDACNWHHYMVTDAWEKDVEGEFSFGPNHWHSVNETANRFREMFQLIRGKLDAAGCAQPFVSSEWAMPILTDEYIAAIKRIGLLSPVLENVEGMGESQGVDYLQTWLRVFEEVGMKVLIWNCLDDAPAGPMMNKFWGQFCGLRYPDGSPKTKVIEALTWWAKRGAA